MPKQIKSQHFVPLSTIGHAIFQNEPAPQEQAVVVSAISRTYSPKIKCNTAHPESKYVIRFETESDATVEAKVTATNFLHTPDFVQTPVVQESYEFDLAINTADALMQASLDAPKKFKTSKRAKRSNAIHPIFDTIVVDDFINHMEVVEQEALDGTDESESVILTLDSLLEDIAETESNQFDYRSLSSTVQDNLESTGGSQQTDQIFVPLLMQTQEAQPTEAQIDVVPMPHRSYMSNTTYIPMLQPLATEPPVTPEAPAAPNKKRQPRTMQVGWSKTLAVFIGLSFAVVLPIHAVTTMNDVGKTKGSILDSGASALSAIENAASAAVAQDFSKATSDFDRAASSFAQAQQDLAKANSKLLGIAELIPSTGKQVKDGRLLLEAGEATARAAATLTDGMATVANRTTASPAAAVSLFDVFAEQAIPYMRSAVEALNQVNASSIPASNRANLQEAKEIISKVTASLEIFHESSGAIQTMLGHKQRQRYLVLFQNNTELRPTGGFWGSLAEVDILDGELVSISIPGGGTYDQQGQLQAQVQAPGPLQLLRSRWELQDANWFPDFPTSAKTAMRFYEQGGGPTVDGVIAINATMVASLMDVTGPIDLPEYGMTIDSENFLFQTQKQVEMDYDKEINQPKSFIGDLAPPLLDKIMNSNGEQFLQIAQLFSQALSDRDIQIYHTNPDIQSALVHLGWDGSILGNTGDYLMVTHTNVGGGKTDGVIDDKVSVESTVRTDGRIENLVSIERAHHGIASALFSGANNVSFTRIFVPRGSELLSVTGANAPSADLFESVDGLGVDSELTRIEKTTVDQNTGTHVTDGLGKTSFGQWLQTKAGTSSTLTFRYLLPSDILEEPKDPTLATLGSYIGIPKTVRHSIVIQAQPGVSYRETSYVFNSGSLRPLWSTAETVSKFALEKNTDGFFGMVLERP